MARQDPIIVVGAGIAGLAAAFRLDEAGFPVRVLEAADHVGGRMWTIEKDGFRIDTGAAVLSSRYRRLRQLIADAGLAGEVQPASNLIGFLRDGRVHRLRTTHPSDVVRTGLLSPRAKLTLGNAAVDLARSWRSLDIYDLGKSAALDTETLHDYARRRFGPEVLEYIVEPTATALSFGSADEMSKIGFLWALRRVFGGSFLNSEKGMGFLPAGLARRLDVTLGARVDEVEEVRGGVRVTWTSDLGGPRVEEAAAVVIALPSPSLARLYPQLDPVRREVLAGLRYSASLHVHFGLSRTPPEPSAIVFMPPARHEDLCLIFFEHNKAPGRAPAGKGLLGTFWHRRFTQAHWDLDDDKVAAVARERLDRALPGVVDDVEMVHVTRADPCVVVNHAGLCWEQARFAAATDTRSRVQLAGDYFSCSSTNTSVCLGEQAARRIIDLSF